MCIRDRFWIWARWIWARWALRHDRRWLSYCSSALEAVASGAIPVEKALRELSIMEVAKVQDYARLDLDRVRRKGIPEVVYAPPKTTSAFAEIVAAFVRERGVALASRVDAEKEEAARQAVGSHNDLEWLYDEETGILEVTASGYALPGPAGSLGAVG